MIAVFAIVTLVLCVLAVRDELRAGGSLHVDLVAHLAPAREGDVAEVIEFPVTGTWSPDEILLTVAEIEAL